MHKNFKLSFLKWAGGKKRHVLILNKYAPNRIQRYFEPFLGSGAFFFYLFQNRKKDFEANISDSNSELINTYKIVRDNVGELIEILKEHQKRYFENKVKYYYQTRDEHFAKTNTERAARFIFLNKTCYNGLYRVNKAGNFNVPHGKYLNPKICNIEVLSNVSEILCHPNVKINCESYKSAISKCEDRDFIYLDPPYFPTTKTANFTNYTKEKFKIFEHNELAEEFQKLSNKGSKIILSNSNSGYIISLYQQYHIEKIRTTRNINCDSKKRKNSHYDLIILNYAIEKNKKKLQIPNFNKSNKNTKNTKQTIKI